MPPRHSVDVKIYYQLFKSFCVVNIYIEGLFLHNSKLFFFFPFTVTKCRLLCIGTWHLTEKRTGLFIKNFTLVPSWTKNLNHTWIMPQISKLGRASANQTLGCLFGGPRGRFRFLVRDLFLLILFCKDSHFTGSVLLETKRSSCSSKTKWKTF